MNNKESNSKPDPFESLMKWEEAFQDLLDQIYFKGFAKQLAKEDRETYQLEYYYFISLYDEPPPPI